MKNLSQFLLVGVDIHKDFHVAVPTDCWHQPLATLTVANNPLCFADFENQVIKLASQHDLIPIFGLEDSGGNGELFAKYLLTQGYVVKEVNPIKSERQRKRNPHPEKTDPKDALAISKTLISEFTKLHNVVTVDETVVATDNLSLHRENLVKDQTRIKNRLHYLLKKEYPNYAKMFKGSFGKAALEFWKTFPVQSRLCEVTPKRLLHFLKKHSHNRLSQKNVSQIFENIDPKPETSVLKDTRALIIKDLAEALLALRLKLKEVNQQLAGLTEQSAKLLLTLDGVSTVIAAKMIGEIKDVSRFKTPNQLARFAGIAPVEYSSGNHIKHRRDYRGNRRLNNAFYTIALTQLRCNEKAKAYYQRKISEGKSEKEAIICLMRRLVDIVHNILKTNTPYKG